MAFQTTTLTSAEYETKTLEERVLEWTEDYCEALAENYKRYHLKSMKYLNAQSGSEYSRKEIEATENGTANLVRFRIQSGKKYYKVIQQDYDTFQDRNEYRDGSVHAFIDRNTGEVYKPASWKSPAKIVRYDLRLIAHRAKLHDPKFTDWAGGYLYLR